jgi:Tfp pilus assembly protein PilF
MGAFVSGAVRLLVACLLCVAGHPAGIARSADPPAGSPPASGETLEALWERGERAFEAGDLAAAERDFLAALSRDEHRARTWNYLGGVHFAQGDLPRALEEFRRALAEDPRDVRACNNLGTVLQRLGDFAGAEEHYLRAAAERFPGGRVPGGPRRSAPPRERARGSAATRGGPLPAWRGGGRRGRRG